MYLIGYSLIYDGKVNTAHDSLLFPSADFPRLYIHFRSVTSCCKHALLPMLLLQLTPFVSFLTHLFFSIIPVAIMPSLFSYSFHFF
jgi:hypothetical protein